MGMKLGLATVKGKILAGTMATGLVVGGGVAFANTDAGAALQDWYDAQFNQSVDSAKADVTAYGKSKVPGLASEYNGLKVGATGEINATRDSEIGNAVTEINAAKDSHIDAVESTKEEIVDNMGLQFNNVFQEAWLKMNQLAEQGVAYAENDLTSYTGTKGEAAVAQVTEDLNAAKVSAVTELEEAIEKAKDELTAELNKNEEIITRNMKNQIDWKIEDVRDEVNVLLDELVTKQQSIIAAKAQELENEAKSALDNVVSGM